MILERCDIPIVLAPLAGGPSTPELANLWAGQAYPLTSAAPAAELVRDLREQARETLRRLRS
jgi:NAD(P)H-dependent flavin oxidoreductase YrpB (nitropropane dioxygenase family)